MKLKLLLFLITTSFLSCNKDSNTEDLYDKLLGTWCTMYETIDGEMQLSDSAVATSFYADKKITDYVVVENGTHGEAKQYTYDNNSKTLTSHDRVYTILSVDEVTLRLLVRIKNDKPFERTLRKLDAAPTVESNSLIGDWEYKHSDSDMDLENKTFIFRENGSFNMKEGSTISAIPGTYIYYNGIVAMFYYETFLKIDNIKYQSVSRKLIAKVRSITNNTLLLETSKETIELRKL